MYSSTIAPTRNLLRYLSSGASVVSTFFIVSGIKLINSEAIAAKKPVIATENSSVELGSLFTMGIDYLELGKRAGQMAVEILKGKPVSEIPFEISEKKVLYVNEDTAKALGFDLKNPAFSGATIVKTKN